MSNIKKDLRLLPNYFKKIAFGIIALSILLAVLSISKILLFNKDLIKIVIQNSLLISFLLLALTKDKIEDELTIKLRLQAFATSFIFGVILVIINPYTNLLFDGNFLSDKGTTELLFSMFLFYFIIFFIGKKKR